MCDVRVWLSGDGVCYLFPAHDRNHCMNVLPFAATVLSSHSVPLIAAGDPQWGMLLTPLCGMPMFFVPLP